MNKPIKHPWLVIRDGRTPGKYTVWSQHKTREAAITRVARMFFNGSEGHITVIPAADRAAWNL